MFNHLFLIVSDHNFYLFYTLFGNTTAKQSKCACARRARAARMTNVSRNVVNDVLRCLARCAEKQEALARLPVRHDEAAAVKQQAEDALRDLEIDLCNLAASFVTAPMSGLMFVPLQNEYPLPPRHS